PHHRQRLARGDRQIDPSECAHDAVSLAVLLLQPARLQDRPHARQRLFRVLNLPFVSFQWRAQAPSQRRSACSLSTTPSSKSPAAEPSGSASAARCTAASSAKSACLWASTSRTGSASSAAAAATSFRWNSAGAGLGQLVS